MLLLCKLPGLVAEVYCVKNRSAVYAQNEAFTSAASWLVTQPTYVQAFWWATLSFLHHMLCLACCQVCQRDQGFLSAEEKPGTTPEGW